MKLGDYLKDKKYNVNSFGKLCGLSFGPIKRAVNGRPVSTECAIIIRKFCTEEIDLKIKNPGRRKKNDPNVKRHYKTRRIWLRMMQNCYKEDAISYYMWGARGVRVCKRWHQFEVFLEDLGYVPDGYASLILKNRDLMEYNIDNVIWHKDARLFRKVFLINMQEKETRPFQMTFDENGDINYGKGK